MLNLTQHPDVGAQGGLPMLDRRIRVIVLAVLSALCLAQLCAFGAKKAVLTKKLGSVKAADQRGQV